MRTPLAAALLLGSVLAAGAQGYGPANPYAGRPGIVVDQYGTYRGNANGNPYDPNGVSNPLGRYGSRTSPDSINNPYGAGNPYAGNQYRIIGR